MGFREKQWASGLLVEEIGNTYAGSALVGLTAVLDTATEGQLVLVVSYGSGAGSDAFLIRTTDRLAGAQRKAPSTLEYISRRVEIDYAQYVRFGGKLAAH